MDQPCKWAMCSLLISLAVIPLPAAEPVSVQSQSGQFLVAGIPVGRTASAKAPPRPDKGVQLDPSLLAVSCEKIKRSFWEALKGPDSWQDRVLIQIEPGGSSDDLMVVQSVRFLDRWEYRLSVPAAADRKRLVKTVVEVLLLEMAQRDSAHPVELPPWLGEGLAALLDTSNYGNLTLEPYTSTIQDQHTRDSLYAVRQHLQTNTPLTVDELSWPEEAQRIGKAGETYEHCSHLLVHELLRLKRGHECLQEMLRILPDHLNWQTAFLRSFAEYFPRMIDLDKWWSLSLVLISGRDLSYTWSLPESIQKLEDILAAPVQVRMRTNDLPMATRASLQSIVQEWDFERQQPLLQLKLNHLNALRLRVTREMASLVDGYRRVLRDYLERLPSIDPNNPGAEPLVPPSRAFVRDTVKRLDELDAQRTALQHLLEAATAKRTGTIQATPASNGVPAP